MEALASYDKVYEQMAMILQRILKNWLKIV
jgi:hypothetical protein